MSRPLSAPRADAMLGPGGHPAYADLASDKIRHRVLLARLVHNLRTGFQQSIGLTLERLALQLWLLDLPGAAAVERKGLPRRGVEDFVGDAALTLHVDPRQLIRISAYDHRRIEKSPSSSFFIWDGNWDQRRGDLRISGRYRLISDLDEHRDHLEDTVRYRSLLFDLQRGRPYSSHHEGIVLDTPERIERYLAVYLGFLDDMAKRGFDPARGKDHLGVAITREGKILKVNRGLHRLAMAQRLGLPSIPVRVRAVHRLWWDEVTEGAHGAEALERIVRALQACTPETREGPLDPEPSACFSLEESWPPPRTPVCQKPALDSVSAGA